MTTVLALAVAAPSALAAERHAAPAGAGTACSVAAPCAIGTAFTGASSGDAIVLAAGDYGSPSARLTDQLYDDWKALDVHPEPGAARPRIWSEAEGGAVVLLSPDSRLSGVEIDYSRDDGPGLWGNVSSIDHVSIASKGTGISLSNDTKPSVSIANTSVHATGDGGWGLAISNVRAAPDFTLDVVLRNVTIVDEGTDAPAFWPYSVGINGAKSRLNAAVSNSILRGKDYDVSAGASNAGDGTSVALDHSSFATVRTYGSGTKSATAADVNGNQAAAPLLAADLRQVAGSPTIDAGAADPQAGTTDLEGDPRVVGDAPDIGADEYVTPPPPPPPHGADDGSGGGSTGSDTGAPPTGVAPPVQEDAAGGQTTPGPGPGAGGPAAKPPIALCVVPRLTGKTLKAARAALAKAGCVTGKVASRRVPRKAGKVVTQAAKPGVRLKAGAKVGLVVGRR